MEETVAGIYKHDLFGYICTCPYCGNDVYIEENADDEIMKMIENKEVITSHCNECNNDVDAKLY